MIIYAFIVYTPNCNLKLSLKKEKRKKADRNWLACSSLLTAFTENSRVYIYTHIIRVVRQIHNEVLRCFDAVSKGKFQIYHCYT